MTDDAEALLTAQMVAQDELDQLQGYLQRGRAHQGLDGEALQAAYIEAVRGWADNLLNPEPMQEATDLMSEYRLRDLDPPDELILADIERITSGLQANIEATSSMDEVGATIIETYQAKRLTRQ